MPDKKIVKDRTARDLPANPKNPRRITDQAKSRLQKSLKKLGDLGGIIFNQRTKRLVGGHRRTDELPDDAKITITERFETRLASGTVATGYIEAWGERFSYREVDWTEEDELLAMIGANQHGGEWDYNLLADAFMEVDAKNLDIDLTGFEVDEIASLIDLSGAPPPEPDPGQHTPTHSFTFSIRCKSDEQIIAIRDFFGVLQSGCDFEKFEAKCL